MTVKSLITELQQWMNDGLLTEDDEIFITPDMFSFDESELFSTTCHNMNHPVYDKNNPTRRAVCISALDRVPNFSASEGDKLVRFYGTGYNTIEVGASEKSEDIEEKIALDKANMFKEWLERREKTH